MPYLLNALRKPNMSPSMKLLRLRLARKLEKSACWPLAPCSELIGTEIGGGAATAAVATNKAAKTAAFALFRAALSRPAKHFPRFCDRMDRFGIMHLFAALDSLSIAFRCVDQNKISTNHSH
jgi:hypothetical protein